MLKFAGYRSVLPGLCPVFCNKEQQTGIQNLAEGEKQEMKLRM